MFRFLAKDRSHRQRLELHKAMATIASPEEPEAPAPMEEDIPSPAAMPRRKSVQLEELERPSHRRNAAAGHQHTTVQEEQGGPSGNDLAGMYAPHNDPSRRRSSLDCIRSARRSGASLPRANGPFGAADESSVQARPDAAYSQQRSSDSEDEVSSGPGGEVQSRSARRHQQSKLAQQAQQQSRRNPFDYEMDDAQLVPGHGYTAGGNGRGDTAAGNARYYAGGCGRMAAAEGPSSQFDNRFCDMTGWGGMDQAMHPAGLMQARAAMVAQGRSNINQGNTFPDMM
ncbi:hypothetical protein CLOM_g1590 [Closterium sp. NIES-68]|nr:hypothetical protein CLOM_g1590 [Closterium sp. NIES-68]GJP58351.1 hypothetical protein CLOP_g23274 [Closterium sp. NIES-67]